MQALERENAAMREQIERLSNANSRLHLELVDAHAETAKETKRADAMRDAIKEAHATLISIACHDGPGFPPGTCASMTGPILAKLQPF